MDDGQAAILISIEMKTSSLILYTSFGCMFKLVITQKGFIITNLIYMDPELVFSWTVFDERKINSLT